MADQLYPNAQVAHSAMIAQLSINDPEIRAKGFWRAVIALSDDLDEPVRKQRFLPDAYKINHATHEIEIHEVVRTNDLTENKLTAMGLLWGDFDCEPTEWYPVLYVHREGFTPRQIDLCHWYHRALMNSARRLTGEAA